IATTFFAASIASGHSSLSAYAIDNPSQASAKVGSRVNASLYLLMASSSLPSATQSTAWPYSSALVGIADKPIGSTGWAQPLGEPCSRPPVVQHQFVTERLDALE